ncbi:MAG: hypothetical protein LBG20_03620 [Holosporaceae bacterium]|jgi:hypothetical protein|nr:hypothetical protein [Holosporaceae bacterium]
MKRFAKKGSVFFTAILFAVSFYLEHSCNNSVVYALEQQQPPPPSLPPPPSPGGMETTSPQGCPDDFWSIVPNAFKGNVQQDSMGKWFFTNANGVYNDDLFTFVPKDKWGVAFYQYSPAGEKSVAYQKGMITSIISLNGSAADIDVVLGDPLPISTSTNLGARLIEVILEEKKFTQAAPCWIIPYAGLLWSEKHDHPTNPRIGNDKFDAAFFTPAQWGWAVSCYHRTPIKSVTTNNPLMDNLKRIFDYFLDKSRFAELRQFVANLNISAFTAAVKLGLLNTMSRWDIVVHPIQALLLPWDGGIPENNLEEVSRLKMRAGNNKKWIKRIKNKEFLTAFTQKLHETITDANKVTKKYKLGLCIISPKHFLEINWPIKYFNIGDISCTRRELFEIIRQIEGSPTNITYRNSAFINWHFVRGKLQGTSPQDNSLEIFGAATKIVQSTSGNDEGQLVTSDNMVDCLKGLGKARKTIYLPIGHHVMRANKNVGIVKIKSEKSTTTTTLFGDGIDYQGWADPMNTAAIFSVAQEIETIDFKGLGGSAENARKTVNSFLFQDKIVEAAGNRAAHNLFLLAKFSPSAEEVGKKPFFAIVDKSRASEIAPLMGSNIEPMDSTPCLYNFFDLLLAENGEDKLLSNVIVVAVVKVDPEQLTDDMIKQIESLTTFSPPEIDLSLPLWFVKWQSEGVFDPFDLKIVDAVKLPPTFLPERRDVGDTIGTDTWKQNPKWLGTNIQTIWLSMNRQSSSSTFSNNQSIGYSLDVPWVDLVGLVPDAKVSVKVDAASDRVMEEFYSRLTKDPKATLSFQGRDNADITSSFALNVDNAYNDLLLSNIAKGLLKAEDGNRRITVTGLMPPEILQKYPKFFKYCRDKMHQMKKDPGGQKDWKQRISCTISFPLFSVAPSVNRMAEWALKDGKSFVAEDGVSIIEYWLSASYALLMKILSAKQLDAKQKVVRMDNLHPYLLKKIGWFSDNTRQGFYDFNQMLEVQEALCQICEEMLAAKSSQLNKISSIREIIARVNKGGEAASQGELALVREVIGAFNSNWAESFLKPTTGDAANDTQIDQGVDFAENFVTKSGESFTLNKNRLATLTSLLDMFINDKADALYGALLAEDVVEGVIEKIENLPAHVRHLLCKKSGENVLSPHAKLDGFMGTYKQKRDSLLREWSTKLYSGNTYQGTDFPVVSFCIDAIQKSLPGNASSSVENWTETVSSDPCMRGYVKDVLKFIELSDNPTVAPVNIVFELMSTWKKLYRDNNVLYGQLSAKVEGIEPKRAEEATSSVEVADILSRFGGPDVEYGYVYYSLWLWKHSFEGILQDFNNKYEALDKDELRKQFEYPRKIQPAPQSKKTQGAPGPQKPEDGKNEVPSRPELKQIESNNRSVSYYINTGKLMYGALLWTLGLSPLEQRLNRVGGGDIDLNSPQPNFSDDWKALLCDKVFWATYVMLVMRDMETRRTNKYTTHAALFRITGGAPKVEFSLDEHVFDSERQGDTALFPCTLTNFEDFFSQQTKGSKIWTLRSWRGVQTGHVGMCLPTKECLQKRYNSLKEGNNAAALKEFLNVWGLTLYCLQYKLIPEHVSDVEAALNLLAGPSAEKIPQSPPTRKDTDEAVSATASELGNLLTSDLYKLLVPSGDKSSLDALGPFAIACRDFLSSCTNKSKVFLPAHFSSQAIVFQSISLPDKAYTPHLYKLQERAQARKANIFGTLSYIPHPADSIESLFFVPNIYLAVQHLFHFGQPDGLALFCSDRRKVEEAFTGVTARLRSFLQGGGELAGGESLLILFGLSAFEQTGTLLGQAVFVDADGVPQAFGASRVLDELVALAIFKEYQDVAKKSRLALSSIPVSQQTVQGLRELVKDMPGVVEEFKRRVENESELLKDKAWSTLSDVLRLDDALLSQFKLRYEDRLDMFYSQLQSEKPPSGNDVYNFVRNRFCAPLEKYFFGEKEEGMLGTEVHIVQLNDGSNIAVRELSTSGAANSCGFRSMDITRSVVVANSDEKSRENFVQLLRNAVSNASLSDRELRVRTAVASEVISYWVNEDQSRLHNRSVFEKFSREISGKGWKGDDSEKEQLRGLLYSSSVVVPALSYLLKHRGTTPIGWFEQVRSFFGMLAFLKGELKLGGKSAYANFSAKDSVIFPSNVKDISQFKAVLDYDPETNYWRPIREAVPADILAAYLDCVIAQAGQALETPDGDNLGVIDAIAEICNLNLLVVDCSTKKPWHYYQNSVRDNTIKTLVLVKHPFHYQRAIVVACW